MSNLWTFRRQERAQQTSNNLSRPRLQMSWNRISQIIAIGPVGYAFG